MKKSIIAAGAASIALAAMPVVGVFAVDPQATDTIEVTVESSCTFTSGAGTATYAASGSNGASVDPSTAGSNEHSFTVFCNDNDGYTVTAAAEALTDGNSNTIAYAATLPSGATGAWNATFSQTGSALVIEQLPFTGASTAIVTHTGASATGGETFKATYTAYIGTATPAGTYSGDITYTLAAQ